MKRVWQHYSLGIVLVTLFVLALAGQIIANIQAGAGPWEIVGSVLENWQSEWLQLVTFVVLSRWLLFRDSPQSRDGSDRLERKVEQIRALLITGRRDERPSGSAGPASPVRPEREG